MKRLFCTLVLMAGIVSTSVFGGTVIDAGTFTENGDAYSPSPYSGIFTDVIHFDIATSGLSLIFSGSHTGMAADDMLLTNTSDGADFHLGTVFSESLSLARGSYVFTLSGFALNALDSKIYSDYDLTISAVPLPAAAWLFGSALLGFIAFSARRKI